MTGERLLIAKLKNNVRLLEDPVFGTWFNRCFYFFCILSVAPAKNYFALRNTNFNETYSAA